MGLLEGHTVFATGDRYNVLKDTSLQRGMPGGDGHPEGTSGRAADSPDMDAAISKPSAGR